MRRPRARQELFEGKWRRSAYGLAIRSLPNVPGRYCDDVDALRLSAFALLLPNVT
jgi:hypothetical protein